MIENSLITADDEFISAIATLTYDLQMPESMRTRAVGGCFAITQEHHHGINVLLKANRFASAVALLRPTFEAYVRGAWLDACGSEHEVEGFLEGAEPPQLGKLLLDLENTERFQGGELSAFKSQYWNALCDFTHSGGLHVQRWNTEAGIEPNYEPSEIAQILRFAQYLSGLAAVGAARLAERDDIAEAISKSTLAILTRASNEA